MKLLSLTALCLAAFATLASAETKVGDLMLTDPFTRATLPNAPVAGGFLTIVNMGETDDTLVAATSDIAGTTEIHTMEMDGDVMRMRELEDGLPVPAGEAVELKPGGFHLMFMQLNAPLVEGETVSVTLTFESAGEVTLDLPVGAINARGHGGMSGGGHGTMDTDKPKVSE
ncbi:hypothetical protein SAMN04488515_0004 [Cognatiyoonia koreensis]|uniref:Copper(I)-binding protein n=1 Tax=Cognatiyoonia koreensis TaxID=364200 RepID=A0A1I0MGP0_9RHOB|nr:copper chaperone PCu(A)C [Cognatiyoonia koreensis]SEV87525.1 hypothetical protein SAMN04488515_0004 [Cognatiyoonia koreensis]